MSQQQQQSPAANPRDSLKPDESKANVEAEESTEEIQFTNIDKLHYVLQNYKPEHRGLWKRRTRAWLSDLFKYWPEDGHISDESMEALNNSGPYPVLDAMFKYLQFFTHEFGSFHSRCDDRRQQDINGYSEIVAAASNDDFKEIVSELEKNKHVYGRSPNFTLRIEYTDKILRTIWNRTYTTKNKREFIKKTYRLKKDAEYNRQIYLVFFQYCLLQLMQLKDGIHTIYPDAYKKHGVHRRVPMLQLNTADQVKIPMECSNTSNLQWWLSNTDYPHKYSKKRNPTIKDKRLDILMTLEQDKQRQHYAEEKLDHSMEIHQAWENSSTDEECAVSTDEDCAVCTGMIHQIHILIIGR